MMMIVVLNDGLKWGLGPCWGGGEKRLLFHRRKATRRGIIEFSLDGLLIENGRCW